MLSAADLLSHVDRITDPVALVDRILRAGLLMRASDVHFDPFESFVRVRFRIDGELEEVLRIPSSMQGALTYKVGLGTDVFGNIQRMDNLLESMPTRQLDYKEKLKNLEIQVEIAKQEVEKPFPREEELKEKSARLDQLNILLNMDKRENEIVDGVQDEGEIQPQRESRGWDR